jgi:hypothetical protein
MRAGDLDKLDPAGRDERTLLCRNQLGATKRRENAAHTPSRLQALLALSRSDTFFLADKDSGSVQKPGVEGAACLFVDGVLTITSFLKDCKDLTLLLGDFMNFHSQGMDGNECFMIAVCAGITGGSLDILANNDDGEQHQLQESLRDPGNYYNGVM